MKLAFGQKSFLDVYDVMKHNLNITGIHIIGTQSWQNLYDYRLGDEMWQKIQMQNLKEGYESRSMR